MNVDNKVVSVRSSAILTTSYVAGTALDNSHRVQDFTQLLLYVSFTKGSLTSMELKVEFSDDGGSTVYKETDGIISGGVATEATYVHQFTATGNYRLAIPINDPYIKVSVKGTGTVTSSLAAIKAVLARN